MFLLSWFHHVGAFTPPALPGFFAIPTPIADRWSSARLLSPVVFAYSGRSEILPKNLHGPPGLQPSSLDLLDAAYDPGAGQKTHLIAFPPVACGHSHALGLSLRQLFGARRIQCPTLHLAVLPSLPMDSSVYSAWLGLSIGGVPPPERRPFPGLRLFAAAPLGPICGGHNSRPGASPQAVCSYPLRGL
jgi:hypothetical protein